LYIARFNGIFGIKKLIKVGAVGWLEKTRMLARGQYRTICVGTRCYEIRYVDTKKCEFMGIMSVDYVRLGAVIKGAHHIHDYVCGYRIEFSKGVATASMEYRGLPNNILVF